MSRFATIEASRTRPRRPTINRAGGPAYEQSDKVKFASILLTSFVTDQYYRSGNDTVKELVSLLDSVDPEFAAKAAVYARNEFGMRTITHIVGGEIPARVKGERWTKNFIDKVVFRPDDATEILAYYLARYGKPVPNSLKKGLALAISKFDAYQLAKYRGDKNAVSLVDVLNLVHPRPNSKNRDAFEALVDGVLKSERTFEAKLSAAGQVKDKQAAKQQAWAELLVEENIGQMALLKNLRNIEEQAPELLPKALELLVRPSRVQKSKILPFRYATALEQVNERATVEALSDALDIACSNVPTLDGRTLIAVDHSGSMGRDGLSGVNSGYRWGAQADSKTPRRIANVLAAVMAKANNADVMVFGNDARYVRGINSNDSTLTIHRLIDGTDAGHATNYGAVFDRATKDYDRVITVSDQQSWKGTGWGSSSPEPNAKRYAKHYRGGVHPHYYNLDVAGYGTSLFPADRVYELAGFSEKVFDIMKVLETDRNALVNAIERVEL